MDGGKNGNDSGVGSPSIRKTYYLTRWVFKLVLHQQTVCVEGFRSDLPDKCWHSTSIRKRITSTTLQTDRGTIYILKGPLDIEAAIAYGYPNNLIQRFKDGFPPDWEELLYDIFQTRTHNLDVSEWYHDMETSRCKSILPKRRTTMCKVMDPLLEASPVEEIEQENSENNGDLNLVSVSPPAVKTYNLSRWIFKLVLDQQTVCVEGFRTDLPDKCWHSTSITKRIDSTTLQTDCGTVYILEGPLDVEAAIAYGYPNSLIHRFKNGFPSDWEELLYDIFQTRINNLDVSEWYHDNMETSQRKSLLAKRRTTQYKILEPVLETSLVKEMEEEDDVSDDNLTVGTPAVKKTYLTRWIFKLVLDQQAVCVEGFKSDLPDKCWHSTSITKRIDARTLETDTGTIYILEGPLDTEAGIAYGYPNSLMQRFKDGFPSDWQELLYDMFQTRKHNLDVSEWYHNNIETSYRKSLLPERRRTQYKIMDPVLERSPAEEMEEEGDGEEMEEEEDENDDSGVSSPSVRKTYLTRWIFKLVLDQQAVCVEGFRSDLPDKCWHSTSISKRIDSRNLQTESGTIYVLIGPLDMEAGKTYEYPSSLMNRFKDGFPLNWEELLCNFFHTRIHNLDVSEWYNDMERSRSKFLLSKRGPKQYKTFEPVIELSDTKDTNKIDGKILSSKENETVLKKAVESNPIISTDIQKSKSPVFKVPVGLPIGRKTKRKAGQSNITSEAPSMMQDVSNRLEEAGLDDRFSVSRSGRIVKPPLASWTGQRILYDIENNPIGVTDGTTHCALGHLNSRLSLAPLSQVLDVTLPSTTHQVEPSLITRERKKRRKSKFKKLVVYSDSEQSDEGSPEPKKRKRPKEQKTKKAEFRKTKSTRVRSPSPDEDSDDNDSVSTVVEKPKRKQKAKPAKKNLSKLTKKPPQVNDSQKKTPEKKKPTRKRWTNEELKRLQIALKACKPRTEDDWTKVALSFGDGRTAVRCKEVADRVFGYDLQIQEEDASRLLNTSKMPEVTAKAGTLAHRMQVNRFMDRYIHNVNDEENDLFAQGAVTSDITMPSFVATANDSLLEAMFTPTQGAGAERRFLPGFVDQDESPFMQNADTPNFLNSAAKEQRVRYLHRLKQEGAMQRLDAVKKHQESPFITGRNQSKKTGTNFSEYSSGRQLLRQLENTQQMNDDEEEEESDQDDYFSDDSD